METRYFGTNPQVGVTEEDDDSVTVTIWRTVSVRWFPHEHEGEGYPGMHREGYDLHTLLEQVDRSEHGLRELWDTLPDRRVAPPTVIAVLRYFATLAGLRFALPETVV